MIFDFDGTIADTLHAVIDVFNDLSDEFGYRRGTQKELQLFMGRGLRELAASVGLSWQRLPDLAVRVREEMSRRMHLVLPCPGMAPALAALRARGVGLGILTSNNRENVERFLEHHPTLQFDFISGGSGLFDKHTVLQSLLSARGLALADTCYVGDEVRDVEAARVLGMRAVAVTWGFSSSQLLAACNPDHLIADPNELLSLV
ncbi:MAG TPA: HAD-IA family hydrolase [Polyangiales bacterium]|nr:HAD-IA family hydrolase [Polyangiales bacterium]